MSRLGQLRHKAHRDVELTWRYGYNLRPTLAHRLRGVPLGAEGRRVAANLRRDGVALTSVDALFADTRPFEELATTVAALEADREDEIALARARADEFGGVGEKPYQHALLGRRPVLDPGSVFARFALEPQLRGVADAYFGMRTQVRYYNVWRNFASGAAPRESQRWHRDIRVDHLVLKAFVYLDDVDLGAGPLVYAPGTHAKGRVDPASPTTKGGPGHRQEEHEIAARVHPEDWVTAVGPRGTIVFADTMGYHRGGQALDSDRLVYTCLFTSRASWKGEAFDRPPELPDVDADTAFALNLT